MTHLALLLLIATTLGGQGHYITMFEGTPPNLTSKLVRVEIGGSLVLSGPDTSGLFTLRSIAQTPTQTATAINLAIQSANSKLATSLTNSWASMIGIQTKAVMDAIAGAEKRLFLVAKPVGGPSGIVSVNYGVVPPEIELDVARMQSYVLIK